MMKGNIIARYKPTDRMRDLVKDNSSLILVMGRFCISLGFSDKTVREVCQMHGVDEQTFLEIVNFSSGREYNYEHVSLPSLIGYLKQAHEYYLEFNLPTIRRKLIEALDCAGSSDIAMLIIKLYDEYVSEVRRHMQHENKYVFVYVEQLLQGLCNKSFDINLFGGKHSSIESKLKEFKDIIIQYYPEKNNYLLNEVLLNIIQCEEDLWQHCLIEDKIFVPAVKDLEQKVKKQATTVYVENNPTNDTEHNTLETLTDREKDVLCLIARGKSNKEIAEALYLSVNTVTTHRRNISTKLQIHSSVGLAIYALANKLVSLDEIKK